MNCLIVDDEVLAQDVIETYIDRVDFLTLTGKCNNAFQAFAALCKEPIDLMFLDIKMPEMTGLELIKTLKNPPKIIITTAFHEYALEGYELDITDYLLKPISFERFLKAVQKVESAYTTTAKELPTQVITAGADEFYVKSDRKLIRINPADIIYIEGLKNYLCIYTTFQKVVVLSTMVNIENELKRFPFIHRVHKSFLVNKHFIKEMDNSILHLTTGSEIPLGALYKDAFLNSMRIL